MPWQRTCINKVCRSKVSHVQLLTCTLNHTSLCSRSQRIYRVVTLIQKHRDISCSDVPVSISTFKIQRVEKAVEPSYGTLKLAMTTIAHPAATKLIFWTFCVFPPCFSEHFTVATLFLVVGFLRGEVLCVFG